MSDDVDVELELARDKIFALCESRNGAELVVQWRNLPSEVRRVAMQPHNVPGEPRERTLLTEAARHRT